MVLVCFMVIVDTSRTCKRSLYHVVVSDTSEYLPAYHTKSQSHGPKMLDFGDLKKNMLIYNIVPKGRNFEMGLVYYI